MGRRAGGAEAWGTAATSTAVPPSAQPHRCGRSCVELLVDFDAAGGYHVLGHAIGRSSLPRVPKLLELVTVLVCCRIADAGDPAGQSPALDGGNYFGGNETMVDTVKEMQIEADGPNTSWTTDQCAGRTGQVGRIGRAGWTGGAGGAGQTGKRFKKERKSHTCVADEEHGYITNEIKKLHWRGR